MNKNLYKFKTLINIYIFLLINIILTFANELIKLFQADKTPFEFNLSLSLSSVSALKIWTLITYSFQHLNIVSLLITVIPMQLLFIKLKHYYSAYELGKIYIYASLTGGIAHIFMAPSSFEICGSSGIMLSFLIIYCRFYGQDSFFKIFKRNINMNVFSFILITLDILTIQTDFRPDKSSIANHLGIIIFTYFYIKRDINRIISPLKPSIFTFSQVSAGTTFFKYNSAEKSSPLKRNTGCAANTPSETDIDKILDKISAKGINSLSKQEQDILNKASKLSNK